MTATRGGDPPRQLFGVPEMREFAAAHDDERVRLMMKRIDQLLSNAAKWCDAALKLAQGNARLREATRWRSVEDELPHPTNLVLAWCHYMAPSDAPFKAFYNQNQWWTDDGYKTDVDYWQPLPEPPKEEK